MLILEAIFGVDPKIIFTLARIVVIIIVKWSEMLAGTLLTNVGEKKHPKVRWGCS